MQYIESLLRRPHENCKWFDNCFYIHKTDISVSVSGFLDFEVKRRIFTTELVISFLEVDKKWSKSKRIIFAEEYLLCGLPCRDKRGYGSSMTLCFIFFFLVNLMSWVAYAHKQKLMVHHVS